MNFATNLAMGLRRLALIYSFLVTIAFIITVYILLHRHSNVRSLRCAESHSVVKVEKYSDEDRLPFDIRKTGRFTTLMPSVYDDDTFIMKHMKPLNHIPSILHLTWKTEKVPEFAYDNFIKWKATHPNWTIVFWTDEDVHSYVRTVLKDSELYSVYKRFTKTIVKMDFMRYVILFTIGGVYADIDVTPLRNLEPVISHHSCILAREPEAFPVSVWREGIILASNYFMASRPGHPFMLYLMEHVKKHGAHPHEEAGPFGVTDGLLDFSKVHPLASRDGAVYLAPSLYFNPPHGDKGDAIHLEMLKGRCRNWESTIRADKAFFRRVCRIMETEGRIDFKAMFRHPKFFNHSFIWHGMFNSWASDSATRVKYKSMASLGFRFSRPADLYADRGGETPYDRERRIIKEGFNDH